MDQRTESIRQEIDDTRGSMTNKMEQIESQVYDTVDDVKQSAYEKVEQVKEKVDMQRMVHERPWTMFGASVLAGFVLGSMTGSESRRNNYDYEYSAHRRAYGRDYDRDYGYSERPRGAYRYLDETSYYTGNPTPAEMRRGYGESEGNGERIHGEYHPSHERERAQRESYGDREHRSGSGIRSTVQDQFGSEIEALRRAALSTATSTLRGILQENLPQFAEEFDRARHEQERRYRGGSGPQHAQRTHEESGGQREQHGQSDIDFTTTQQSSDTPSSIVAPSETGKEGATFETTHQDATTSTSINAPEVEKQR